VIARYIICHPLLTTFTITVYIAVLAYIYVRKYVSYLPTIEHVLFYVIPFVLFGIPMVISYYKNHKWNWALARIFFLIAFWVSFGVSFFYEWNDAKIEYESEMADFFGEDWEEEVERLDSEKAF
jgi:hypothetical protein